MNLTIIGPSKKFLSGITYYTIRLANVLNNQHHISIITINNLLPKFLFPGSNRVGKQLSDLEFDKTIKVCNCLNYYLFPGILKATTFLRKQNPDIIIMQWWSSSAAMNYLLLKVINKLFFNKKIIIEFHEILDPLENNIWILRIYVALISRLLFDNSDAYIVHSNFDKCLINKTYKLDNDKIFVVPHGPYNHYFPKKIKKNKKKIFDILFFGLVRNYKGLKYLIEAFDKIPKGLISNFRLNIIGEIWDEKETIYSMIEDSPYSNRIRLVNRYVSDEEVNLYFTLADVIVLPYIRASQSGVAQIAVSYGKPIIATDLVSLKEALHDYKGALFVKPKNSEQIQKCIWACFKKKKKLHAYNLTWEDILIEYTKILHKIT
ncbi:MAG: glycosyltransferase [Nanoarchaeota archaeon]